jgi:hypothetical protein
MKTSAPTSKSELDDSVHSSNLNRQNEPAFFLQKEPGELFFGPAILQPKLEIGQPDDPYEREADRVAGQVMKMPEPAIQRFDKDEEELQMKRDPAVQMACEECEEKEVRMKPLVQRKAVPGNTQTAPPEIASAIHSKNGSGRPLPEQTQQEMSSKIGADFSGVRIHHDNKAIQLNRDLGAKAFTVGNNIFFNHGQFSPDSGEGKKLLAHELVHTVQQTQSSINHSPKMSYLPSYHTMISASYESESSRKLKIYLNERYLSRVRNFDNTTRNALASGIQNELNFLSESSNIEVQIEFGNIPENSPAGSLQVYLVDTRISRENVKRILESHEIETNDEKLNKIMEYLSSDHGLNVRYPEAEDRNPGAIFVPVGPTFDNLGSRPIPVPDSEETVTHEDNKKRMGAAISRRLLHELGHGFGLSHNEESGIMRKNPRVVTTYTEEDFLEQNFTESEHEAIIENIIQWMEFKKD